PSNPNPAHWVLWGMLGPVTSQTLYGAPIVLCLPPHHLFPNDTRLFTVANSFYPVDPLAIVPFTSPAPYSIVAAAGFPIPAVVTLQGMIEDPLAPTAPYATTNGIQITIQ
ncbi:MAG: hypothetical protein KDB53_12560, partial [Planctomycetes bacterium]|nr:hypothetical protein [Planctomycetota bacterium]